MQTTVRGLVLREVDWRDSDKILTILTAERGHLTASARGSRRKGSRLKAGTQVLVCADFTLFENRGKFSVNEADTVELFMGLRSDLEKLSLGAYFAEVLEAVSGEDVQSGALLTDGLNALYALSNGIKPPALVKAAFEFRTAALAGFAPEVSQCAACGDETPAQPALNILDGEILCDACVRASGAVTMSLDTPSLMALRHLMNAESQRMLSFALGGASTELLAAAAERYLLTHLDRGFSTLDFYKRL